MGGPGAARTLETAVRDLSMTALRQVSYPRVKHCNRLSETYGPKLQRHCINKIMLSFSFFPSLVSSTLNFMYIHVHSNTPAQPH